MLHSADAPSVGLVGDVEHPCKRTSSAGELLVVVD